MYISVFQMFKIGIGPSSSHTVGPMKAAKEFLLKAKKNQLLNPNIVKSMRTDLYGSLALTGKGHATDRAVILGMMGEDPDTVDTSNIYDTVDRLNEEKKVKLLNNFEVDFKINFLRSQKLPYHSNAMKFTLLNKNNEEIFKDIYYSIGGGFIFNEADNQNKTEKTKNVPFPFEKAKDLFSLCAENKMTIPQLIMENEKALMPEHEVKAKIDRIWEVMQKCIERGLNTPGTLPGPLAVKRRAPPLYEKLKSGDSLDPMDYLNWINVFALAVSEENAIGGQVVTSPTNGSAGVIPAVLSYFNKFHSNKASKDKIYDFFLTASAIGSIFKTNATISGAEGGCQAEIGVSASMAAGGLACALGGSITQIENAAEMAMEHFIGMTCDPIGGLVQIPCIERNAVGAVKAVNVTALALSENHSNKVSLDKIVKVMKKTGEDMKTKYKETSKGGLAKEFEKEVKIGTSDGKKDSDMFKIPLPETLC
jgi:L-serine dehydratase